MGIKELMDRMFELMEDAPCYGSIVSSIYTCQDSGQLAVRIKTDGRKSFTVLSTAQYILNMMRKYIMVKAEENQKTKMNENRRGDL